PPEASTSQQSLSSAGQAPAGRLPPQAAGPRKSPDAGPGKDYATGRKNMQSLIQLRWLARPGQLAPIAAVYHGLDLHLPRDPTQARARTTPPAARTCRA